MGPYSFTNIVGCLKKAWVDSHSNARGDKRFASDAPRRYPHPSESKQLRNLVVECSSRAMILGPKSYTHGGVGRGRAKKKHAFISSAKIESHDVFLVADEQDSPDKSGDGP